jgi:hypothetical protein
VTHGPSPPEVPCGLYAAIYWNDRDYLRRRVKEPRSFAHRRALTRQCLRTLHWWPRCQKVTRLRRDAGHVQREHSFEGNLVRVAVKRRSSPVTGRSVSMEPSAPRFRTNAVSFALTEVVLFVEHVVEERLEKLGRRGWRATPAWPSAHALWRPIDPAGLVQ